MIVKNESETLDRCLSHARPFVDEIVIVDTGSTDGTQEIAKKYADVFDEIEWPNSFAKARNYSMDLVTSDYILILDGDEYLPNPDHWALLRSLIDSQDVAALQLRVRNVLGPEELIAADSIIQDRVFRNHPLIRYDGSVHNQIEIGLDAFRKKMGGARLAADVEIIHTGYALSRDRMRLKYAPRIKLLEAEYHGATSGRYRSYYGYQLALGFFVLGRYDEAHAVFGELNYQLMSPENAFYAHVLASQISLKLSDAERALTHCNEMLTITRKEPVAYYTTGLSLLLAGKPGDGMLMMMGALDVMHEFKEGSRFQLNNRVLIERIANLYGRMGMDKQKRVLMSTVESSKEELAFEDLRGLLLDLKLQIIASERQDLPVA
jgi:glycosyltransferase involved in cell wall biosynthesis